MKGPISFDKFEDILYCSRLQSVELGPSKAPMKSSFILSIEAGIQKGSYLLPNHLISFNPYYGPSINA